MFSILWPGDGGVLRKGLRAWEGNGFPWVRKFDLLTSFISLHPLPLHIWEFPHFPYIPYLSWQTDLSMDVALSLIYWMIRTPGTAVAGTCFSIGIFFWHSVHWLNIISRFSGCTHWLSSECWLSLLGRGMETDFPCIILIPFGCYESNYYHQLMK